jgi:hypothetical protein
LPDDVHHDCLNDFKALYPGEDRYFDQQLTNDHGQVIGTRRFDRVPEWALGHIIQNREFDVDDPRAYREPAAYDLMKIREWLFEYRSTEEQMRDIRETKRKRKEALEHERVDVLARDIRDSKIIWGDTADVDMGRRPAMEGTEI